MAPKGSAGDIRRGAAIRRRSTEERRSLLLDRLEEIYLAEGFSSITIDDLCRRLGCSKTTLYSVADSREQIIQAVTRHFFARATETIEREVAGETDAGRRVVRYLTGVGAAMRRNSIAFYVDMVSYEPTASIYRLNSDAAATRVRGFIEEGVAAGQFRKANAALAGQAIALLIEGVQSGELLERTGLTAGEAFSELGELIVNGLSVRD
ncbi:TetR/AcrR family transcriptional regulator [Microbacterium lacticum]